MIKVFELLKNSKIKGYKMKTIRNSVFIGASLLGGCACVKDACYRERSVLHAQKL